MTLIVYSVTLDDVTMPTPSAKAGIAGHPKETTKRLWSGKDSTLQVGVWECTPGSFTTERNGIDEIILLLAGRGVLVAEDGTETPHCAGDVLVIPDGFRGIWHIHETLRKVYVAALPGGRVPPVDRNSLT